MTMNTSKISTSKYHTPNTVQTLVLDNMFFFACKHYSPLTKQEMDALYKVYKQIRLQQMLNQTSSEFKEDPNILFYTVERVNDSDKFTKRALDIGSAVGLLTFLYSQLDVVTALSVVANLEKRAQYDPQFRTSFPTFLRQNSWFL